MSATDKPLGIAFFGAGDVSPLHAEGVRRCPDAHLVGLWDLTPEQGREKAVAFGCRTYDSPEQLLADPEVDAVSVLTPLETHHRYASMALEAGKHVLVEKPVGVSVAEIESLRDLATRTGRVCLPGHNFIHEDSIIRTKELIDGGDLGRLVAIYVMYHIHHPEEVAARYPGVIRQILTHNSYVLLYLAGRARQVSAMKATLSYEELDREDIAMVNVGMANGALAHFCASFAADDHSADPWTMMVKVIGTAGSTRYSYRDWVELKPAAVHSQTYTAYRGSIINEVARFVQICRGDAEPLSTLADAIEAQRLIEAVETSISEGRTVDLQSA
ncbi:MAG TPA: Gfo/Idh/MocA family oxidoreductase [Candidatus Latescibacteria bacterium]|nr:oxidoreductase [Gemmatimonadaceae bacterium]MDP6016821.1 Gfo/Idh/MocA family oxidoreductase [Candidatus Latescibacterota bacterium]HJP32258.1 Gfo/Idh/MocA family oxidoreductase [Candidatus Latescibacterota bacterium]